MADKKESFTVTDRRLFTPEGELRKESSDEVKVPQAERPLEEPKTPPSEAKAAQTPSPTEAPNQDARPAAPETAQSDEADVPLTPDEQQAGADAYKQSSKDLDARVELSGHSAKDLEMT